MAPSQVSIYFIVQGRLRGPGRVDPMFICLQQTILLNFHLAEPNLAVTERDGHKKYRE